MIHSWVLKICAGHDQLKSQVEEQRKALEASAERWDDVATITDRDGTYTNTGFFRASAERCRRVAQGGKWMDPVSASSVKPPELCQHCGGTGQHNCSIPEHVCAYCNGTGKPPCAYADGCEKEGGCERTNRMCDKPDMVAGTCTEFESPYGGYLLDAKNCKKHNRALDTVAADRIRRIREGVAGLYNADGSKGYGGTYHQVAITQALAAIDRISAETVAEAGMVIDDFKERKEGEGADR